MNIWELSILKIIAGNNGCASLQYIYRDIPKLIPLTHNHTEVSYSAP